MQSDEKALAWKYKKWPKHEAHSWTTLVTLRALLQRFACFVVVVFFKKGKNLVQAVTWDSSTWHDYCRCAHRILPASSTMAMTKTTSWGENNILSNHSQYVTVQFQRTQGGALRDAIHESLNGSERGFQRRPKSTLALWTRLNKLGKKTFFFKFRKRTYIKRWTG